MSRNRPILPCAAVALVFGMGFVRGAEIRLPVDSFEPGYGDVVASEGARPISTADKAQRRLIGALLQDAAEAQKLESVTVDYPLEGSIFPPDMIAPTFLWHDHSKAADRWLVEISLEGASRLRVLVPGLAPPVGEVDPEAMSDTNEIYQPPEYEASAMAWRPDADVWSEITKRSVKQPAKITFIGYREAETGEALSRGTVTLTTSVDPVGAPIFYRDVPLMPPEQGSGQIMPIVKRGVPLIAWRLRSISRPDSRVLFNDMPTCANCHSFSADGKTLGMDIDGPQGDKGAYTISPIEKHMVIENDEIITWNSFEDKFPPGHKTLGFLSRISPDGQHVVTTLNEMIYVANFPDYRFGQVFFPTRGILGYYSKATGEMKALPGADDRDYVHADGVWSPDGKTIVFARAEAKDPFPEGRAMATYAGDPRETQIQYDLYRLPFNEGRGGTPEPVLGASSNGMSNNFPKVSPDGKWIVFVKCKNGQLMRPDSKLWIVPATGGEARLMRCNTPLMNSWHSFSPNGRWMVFSSKSRSPYTQMFLTHIDENGNDSPAILIENSTAANRAVNIPEFVNIGDDDLIDVQVPAVSHYRIFHRGNILAEQGRFREAVAEYEKALRNEPDAARMHAKLGKALVQLGETDKALKHTRLALETNPYNYEMQTNMGYLLAAKGQYDEARKYLDFAIALHPRHQFAWYNRATLNLHVGDLAAALSDYNETLQREPRYPDALDGRGVVLLTLGNAEGALADFDESLRLKPASGKARYLRARARVKAGDLQGAADDVRQALERIPPGSPARAEVESLKRRIDAAIDESR